MSTREDSGILPFAFRHTCYRNNFLHLHGLLSIWINYKVFKIVQQELYQTLVDAPTELLFLIPLSHYRWYNPRFLGSR